jgi:hypothetical protein
LPLTEQKPAFFPFNILFFCLQTTMSLKMDLRVPAASPSSAGMYSDLGDSYDDLLAPPDLGTVEVFFVSVQAHLGGRNESSGNIILETVDRVTPYSHYAACADPSVKLQLCICDVPAVNASETKTGRTSQSLKSDRPSDFGKAQASKSSSVSKLDMDSLVDDSLYVEVEVLVAEGTEECLVLVVKKNEHGGVFIAANLCQGRAFQILFTLETTEMYVSDAMPREELVYPGQQMFLCMAVKNAPKAQWDWSYTLQQKSQIW